MNRTVNILLAASLAVLSVMCSDAHGEQVEVLWLGQSATRITSTTGKVIVIDPFLKKNPKTPAQYRDLDALGPVDLILVTHGHDDHTRDLVELAQLTGATVVATYELMFQFIDMGLLDASRTIGMNKGGTVEPFGRDIKIHMVSADHSSGVSVAILGLEDPDKVQPRYFFAGPPVGYVIELENGFTIYHSGDTNVFGDMALIHEFHEPDLALVCIGGHFTMNPQSAAYALRELLRPEMVIPIHYGTYPIINRTPDELVDALGDAPIKVLDVQPGEALHF